MSNNETICSGSITPPIRKEAWDIVHLQDENKTLKAALSAKDSSHKLLVDALEGVDILWGGEAGFIEESNACKEQYLDSPMFIVWKQIRAALKAARGE